MIDLILENLQAFYGLDYAGMVFLFLMMYELSEKKRMGFIYGVLGSLCWIGFNYIAGSFAGVFMNAVLILINFRGFFRWKRASEKK